MTPCLRQTPGGSLWSSSPAGRLPANAVGKIFINRRRDDNDDGHVAARFGSSVTGGEMFQTEGPGVGWGVAEGAICETDRPPRLPDAEEEPEPKFILQQQPTEHANRLRG